MEEKILTETELETILNRSRFTDKEHKRKLFEKIFGEKQNVCESESARVPALSLDELELVAGGKAAFPEAWKSRTDNQ